MQTRSGNWYIVVKHDNHCNQSTLMQLEKQDDYISCVRLRDLIHLFLDEFIYERWRPRKSYIIR